MKFMHARRRTMVSALLAAGLWASAAQAEEGASPGITDSSIKIGVTGALTGPVAALGAVVEGIRVKVDAVNAAGGVAMADGKTRAIELMIEDDGLDPQRSLSNVRKLVERDEVFALVGTAGTPNNEAIGRYVHQREVPNLFMYSGVHELKSGQDWVIGLAPSFTTEAAVFAEHLKQTAPRAKIALLYLNTETGLTFQAALKAAVAGSGVRIVAEQPVTATDPTVDTQLSNLKASGADTLVIIAAPKQSAQAVRFAAESGWHPVTLVSYIASSVYALQPAGLENAKGVITSQFIRPIDASAPDAGADQYLADYAMARPRFELGDALGHMGYLTGEALVAVLGAMQQPTRAAMMEAARNMNDVSVGMLLPGITLTTKGAEDIYPIESLQLYQFDGAAYQPLGDVVSYEAMTPSL